MLQHPAERRGERTIDICGQRLQHVQALEHQRPFHAVRSQHEREVVVVRVGHVLVAFRNELLRLVVQCLRHGRTTLCVRGFLLVGRQHVAQLADQPLHLACVLQVVLLQTLSGIVVELAHGLDEDLGDIVGRLPQSRAHQQRGERVPLGRRERLHLGGVERAGLEGQLRHLRGRHAIELRQAFGVDGQPADVLQEARDLSLGRLLGFALEPVPIRFAALAVEQRVQALASGGIERRRRALVDRLVHLLPGGLGHAQQHSESRQHVVLLDQFLQHDVDDVGQFLLGAGRRFRTLRDPAHRSGVRVVQVEGLEHQLPVPRILGAVVIAAQHLLCRSPHLQLATHERGDGQWHPGQRHRIAQALHQLELQHGARLGHRPPQGLVAGDERALLGRRRVQLLEFLGRNVVQQPRVRGLFNAAHRAVGRARPVRRGPASCRGRDSGSDWHSFELQMAPTRMLTLKFPRR